MDLKRNPFLSIKREYSWEIMDFALPETEFSNLDTTNILDQMIFGIGAVVCIVRC